MDIRRAEEISNSSNMANVTYNGGRIYIEDVDQNKDTAVIHYLDQPNNSQEVSVSQLVEY